MPDPEQIRAFCLALPHTTESVQWGNNLVFKVGGKIYAVVDLEGSGAARISFKTDPQSFHELTERDGVIPAPYLARASWVALQSWNALPAAELKRLIENAYHLVLARLPKKVRTAL